jgi:hypothetical protein
MVKQAHPIGNHLMNPQLHRALATGIGQTQQRSKASGEHRAQCIADTMTPSVRSKAVGYPAVDPVMAEIRADYPAKDAALPISGKV